MILRRNNKPDKQPVMLDHTWACSLSGPSVLHSMNRRTAKPIAGTYTLTFGGKQTTPIAYNASKRAVAAELEKLKRKRARRWLAKTLMVKFKHKELSKDWDSVTFGWAVCMNPGRFGGCLAPFFAGSEPAVFRRKKDAHDFFCEYGFRTDPKHPDGYAKIVMVRFSPPIAVDGSD